jgi:hypothetical protein
MQHPATSGNRCRRIVALEKVTLFNLPESRGLLRTSDEQGQHYWRRVLQQGLEGNLQSVLDE